MLLLAVIERGGAAEAATLNTSHAFKRGASVERSWLLCLACRLRCPWARVHRGDMWGIGWEGCALVYLFQRPESMERALAKARADMPSGAWLASLEFPVPGVPPDGAIKLGPERSVGNFALLAGVGIGAALLARALRSRETDLRVVR